MESIKEALLLNPTDKEALAVKEEIE